MEKYKKMIDELELNDLKDLMFECLQHNQAMVIDVLQKLSDKSDKSNDDIPKALHEAPEWCICKNCREMPSDLEKMCCNLRPEYCLSKEETMALYVLDEMQLAFSRAMLRDFRQLTDLEPEEANKSNRHHAYRLFVYWRHQRLMKGDRRIIPSCCVWRIRNEFPSPTGVYRGFQPNVQM
ncbi:P2X purinoceptor 7-like [Antedon mediterranea]|uniref:P2X purinoceptor 7-like n=1 Tax=Antedon mediterranea TaxID=105859 RepID=UPI003AF96E01